MLDELRKILVEIGLPPVIISAIIIVVAILVFLIKRTLNRREEIKAKKRETLRDYARLQEEALRKAYRMLYEKVDLNTLSQKEFLHVVAQADDLIMEPFTRYITDLPDDIKAGIFNGPHSDLAQFKPDPTFKREVSSKAIQNLSRYRDRFLQKIDFVMDVIRKYT
jgi:hypothetical protein